MSLKLSKALAFLGMLGVAAADPSGKYAGSTTVLGQKVDATITVDDSSHLDFGISGVVSLTCSKEAYKYDGKSAITLPNAGTSGDCVHDALSQYSGSIQSIDYDSTGDTITVKVKASIVSVSITLSKSKALFGAIQTFDDIDRKTLEYLFESARQEYGYNNDIADAEEYMKRLDIFETNLKDIIAHNNDSTQTFKKAVNQFTHLTPKEFKERFTGYNKARPNLRITGNFNGVSKAQLADSVNWVDQGAVTAVKNQGQCGSCWTFSTTGAIEGAYFLKTGSLKSFSEQNIVDCDTGGNGCNGGDMGQAMGWVTSNGGICLESDYAYTGQSGSCQTSCSKVSGSAPASHTTVSQSESALMSAVSKQPVSIAIEADQSSFQSYSTGVLTTGCGTSLDHGVLVVGYGTENGTDYWLVKNSWGTSWGDQGYIKIQRGNSQSGGLCGILMDATFPTM